MHRREVTIHQAEEHTPRSRGGHAADRSSISEKEGAGGMAPTFEQLEQHRRRIKDAFSLFELEVRTALGPTAGAPAESACGRPGAETVVTAH